MFAIGIIAQCVCVLVYMYVGICVHDCFCLRVCMIGVREKIGVVRKRISREYGGVGGRE